MAACMAGAAILSNGCATRVPERHRGVEVGHQGDASELVFPGAGVVDRTGFEGATWEIARRDEALGGRYVGPPTALDQWPAARRPSLDDVRRLRLERRARDVIYFSERSRIGVGYQSRRIYR